MTVNHFKSKGSACTDDPDTGDGQGNCNLTRVNSARMLADWIATDPAATDIVSNLVIGDLNSYDHEDPIDVLVGAGYTDLVKRDNGEGAWSYVFDGQKGYLDHALGDDPLLYQVTAVAPWGINADEVDLLDYDMTFKSAWQDANLFAPDPYRSSDHDPILVGLALDGTGPALDVTLDRTLLWPPNHKYVTVTATVSATDTSGTADWKLVSVTSSEPDDAPGSHDGNTLDDIVIVDDTHVKLRAERSDTGSGRVYTLTFRATDLVGNTTTVTRTVSVPVTKR